MRVEEEVSEYVPGRDGLVVEGGRKQAVSEDEL